MKPSCRCGCAYDRHRHHRVNEDCGTCGRDVCTHYQPRRQHWWQLWRPA